MKAIIPTGGRGTRMQPLTFSTNKHFIPIAGKPLIYYPIEAIAESGIKNVAITYNPGWLEMVKSFLGDGGKWGLEFTYVLQEKPAGLANIFQVCEEYLAGESFVMHLGDNIFTKGIKKQVEFFEKHKPNALAVIGRHPENTRMGVPYFDKKGKLIKYVEKPKNPPHDFAVIGIYFFDKSVFKCFKGKDKIKPSDRGEYEISSPYQWLIDHKFDVATMEYVGKWLDPGKFDDWIQANQYLLDLNVQGEQQSKVSNETFVEGRVDLGKRTKLEGSELRGPVSIGDDVEIKNSYIGPFTSISDNCVIEDSHVENSVLMPGVIIKNIKQPINESVIGTGAEIINNENGPTDWIKLFVGERSKVKI